MRWPLLRGLFDDGFFLGGGIGFNMRAHGLACDQLVGSELVTADGKVLSLDPASDLFWACRGGAGGNFGINTAFSVRTFPVSSLTAFSLSWTERPRGLYAALLAALDAAPEGLGSRVQITPGREPSVQLLGQYTGTPEQVRDILRPAYAVARPASEDDGLLGGSDQVLVRARVSRLLSGAFALLRGPAQRRGDRHRAGDPTPPTSS